MFAHLKIRINKIEILVGLTQCIRKLRVLDVADGRARENVLDESIKAHRVQKGKLADCVHTNGLGKESYLEEETFASVITIDHIYIA